MNRAAQFISLVRLTALDIVRQPIALILTLSCVLLIGIIPLILLHALGEDGKLARDSGLALQLIFGLFLAGYAAASTLADEIRGGTAAVILSKPVSRPLLLLAKFAGLALVLLLFSTATTTATLLCERVAEKNTYSGDASIGQVDWRTGRWLILAPFLTLALAGLYNYRSRRAFGLAAVLLTVAGLITVLLTSGFFDRTGQTAHYDLRVDWRILPASLLVMMALWIFAALALGLSTRLRTGPVLVTCAVILILGLLSDHWFPGDGGTLATLFPAIIPNWQHFWMADALGDKGRIPWSYVGRMGLYTAAYLAAFLSLAALCFRRVDVD